MSDRERPLLDPAAQRELDAIDAALRGERGPDGMDELENLVAQVRAERPAPREGFARDLDRRVAEGFAQPRGSAASRLERLRARRALVPALSLAASLLVAVVVAANVLQGPSRMDGQQTQSAPGGDGPAAAPEIAPAPEPMPPSAELPRGSSSRDAPQSYVPPIPPNDDRTLPGRRDRRVERQASLVLEAPSERIDEVSDGVIRVTDRVGGIVASSSVQSGDGGRGGATFALRIPTPRLSQALAELSRLAHVRTRIQSSRDVTAGYVSVQERLRESLAQRSPLLGQLARADTAREAERVRARLAIVNAQIAGLRSELSGARERTEFAGIAVTIEPEGRDSSEDGTPGDWSLGDALDNARRVLEVTAGVAIVTAAALAPVVLLGFGLWLAAARVRRSRRERALNED